MFFMYAYNFVQQLEFSTSQIHKAAFYGDIEEFEELIRKGSNPCRIEEVNYRVYISDCYACKNQFVLFVL